MDYKNIHIGNYIKQISEIKSLDMSKAILYFKCTHQEVVNMYNQKTLDSGILLKWCKLLNYNFFMYYHTHLQIYKPLASSAKIPEDLMEGQDKSFKEYSFKKNLYSPYIIDWILDKIKKKELTPKDVMDKYRIPKTTVYRWMKRYKE